MTCTGPGGNDTDNATVTVSTATYYPPPRTAGDWRRLVAINATPTAAEKANIQAVAGIDWDQLKVARDYSEALSSSTVLVIRNGWIAGEWGSTSANKVASVTKSFVGLAMAKLMDMSDAGQLAQSIGLQSLAHPYLAAAFGNSDPLKLQIRIEHLMTMSSGIEPEDPDFLTEQERLTQPMDAAPGAEWVYSSLPPNLLSMILQGLAGQNFGAFFNSRIGSVIGTDAIVWETIDGGYTRGAHGARVRPRDLARYAYLTLQDGVWDDGSGANQVISASRVGMLTTPAPVLAGVTFRASPGSPFPLPSDAPNHFGHLFWTNATQVALGSSVPTDAYYMHGCRDNLVVVVPSKNLIVVRAATSGPCTQTTFRSEFMQRVMASLTN
jgi:CubicO group peptidase (beta-lactamase class C family)